MKLERIEKVNSKSPIGLRLILCFTLSESSKVKSWNPLQTGDLEACFILRILQRVASVFSKSFPGLWGALVMLLASWRVLASCTKEMSESHNQKKPAKNPSRSVLGRAENKLETHHQNGMFWWPSADAFNEPWGRRESQKFIFGHLRNDPPSSWLCKEREKAENIFAPCFIHVAYDIIAFLRHYLIKIKKNVSTSSPVCSFENERKVGHEFHF